jgi:hypothetical protein
MPVISSALLFFFGAILPLDLRHIGCWRQIPLAQVVQLLLPPAVAGLVLAATCGILLFLARSTEYAASPYFQVKMLLIAVGLVNAALFVRIQRRAGGRDMPNLISKTLGILSLLLWAGVILLGRLVGYF